MSAVHQYTSSTLHSSRPRMLTSNINLLVGFATFDINQDKADCTDKLVGLVGCLPYVGGGASAPTMIVALVSNKLSTITRDLLHLQPNSPDTKVFLLAPLQALLVLQRDNHQVVRAIIMEGGERSGW
ncbi:uncharacterized protein HKW66_Vig0033810 [Vigna angularis]|uniref:Uncharacterized protein n=1 Tax=Phaseolus angularis TaxID=3914 RepID=A0A8T0L957_PHAAN|nr:uncharacterized protein HKW66_Vig0033810 [Vigna angularis]